MKHRTLFIAGMTSFFLFSSFFFEGWNFRRKNIAFSEDIDNSLLSSVPRTCEEKYDSFLITGTPEYLATAKSQLDLIRERDAVSWKKVKENVKKISLTGKTVAGII